MPREATSEELELLHSNGQAAKWYAAFFPSNIIYTAILSVVPSTTDQIAQISFTSGSGTLADVKRDMLLKVGSFVGGEDLGICRIRKAPIAGTFYIDEQSLIDWNEAPTVYLTVVDDFDLRARHIRIDGTTVYMDYDIPFSDQHTVFSPVPVLGPIVRVLELIEDTGFIKVGPEIGYNSWVFGSTISTYLWSSPSTGVSFDDTALARPTVTATTPGWKLLYCTVTATNGKSRQGVRYLYVWDKDNLPLTVFQVSDFTEDEKSSGSNFTLVFPDGVSLNDVPDRSLCVLFSQDYYGLDQEKISIGAVEGAENVIGVGRAISETLNYDMETKTTSIEVVGYQELMKQIHGFPAGLRFKITPTEWTHMPALTVDRGLYHLLEFHTTAITIMDFIPTNDTRYTKQSFSAFSSIWDQMQQFAYKQILARSFVDHLGRLFFQIDPNYTPVDDRGYPVVMEIIDNDLTGRVELPRNFLHQTGQVNLSGVAIDNGGNPSAFFSLSAGHIHARTGNVKVNDYLLLSDQTQANQLAGLIFGAENNKYKPIRLKLRANNRLVTCFPNQAIAYTISEEKNPRGFAITKNWIPRQRKISYDGAMGIVEIELVVEAETLPAVAVKGDMPGSTSFQFPPLPSLPPLPSIPPFPGGNEPISDGGPPRVLVHSPSSGILICDNFDAPENEQEWYIANGGLTTRQYQTLNRIVVCPNGAVYVGCCNDQINTDVFIARAPYPGGIFEIVEDRTSLLAKYSPHTGIIQLVTFACNPLLPESVAYVIYPFTISDTIYDIYFGSGSTFSMVQTVTGVYASIGSISYGLGKWVLTHGVFGTGSSMKVLSSDLTTTISSDLIGPLTMPNHNRVSTTGKIYHMVDNSNTIAITEDNDAGSVINSVGNDYFGSLYLIPDDCRFATDPTGQYILTINTTNGKGYSTDFGYTLSNIANLPFTGGGNWRFAYAGTPDRWVAVGSYVYYTDDFFLATPGKDCRGNILNLVPVLDLNIVKVLGF